MKNRIKELREAHGWSQEKLAAEAGTSGPQINRLEKGHRRLTQDWMGKISDALGCHPSDLLPPHRAAASDNLSRAELREPVPFETVPVLGRKAGRGGDSIILAPNEEWGCVPLHPMQAGSRKPFAFYVRGDSMTPRYMPGELVWVVHGRPPAEGQDCLVELAGGESYLRQFVREAGSKILFRQLNPAKEWRRDAKDVKEIYPVVGRG